MASPDDLVAHARELAPLVAKGAADADRAGSLPDDLVDAFCDAGVMQTLVPKKFGGHEFSYGTMAKIIAEIAPHNTSAAWVIAFYIGHNFIHALFPEKSQEEVFATRPYSLTPGTIAPSFGLTPVKGGYLAKGRSAWNSGASRSDWFLCNGMVHVDGEAPTLRAFLVPAGEVQVLDNWDVAGMKGTASHDAELEDVFIPEHRTVDTRELLEGRAPGASVHKNPFYSLPLLPFVLGEVVPVVVGAYRGAADEYKRLTVSRLTTHTSAKVAGKQTAQMRIGHSQAGAALAEGMLADYIMDLEHPDVDRFRSVAARAAVRARCAMITDYCATGINYLMRGAGAGAYRNDCSMQRYFRDINMLSVHAFLDLEVGAETYGRVLLGLPPEAPL